MLTLAKRISIITIIGLLVGIYIEDGNKAIANSYVDELGDYWVQPVSGEITDRFGTRNGNHKGVDIVAPEGEKIVSVSDGTVTKSYYSDSYGHVVFIEHPEGYETVYAHLSKRSLNEGDSVNKGQAVGIIGNTGKSTGTHLHFELHKGEWTYDKAHALDPLFVFDLPASTVATDHKRNVEKEEKLDDKVNEANDENKQSIHTDIHSHSVGNVNITEKNQQGTVVKVTKGETLWEISQTFKVTIKSLQEWNKLDSNLIYPGQELTVYLNKEKSYIVQAGDTIHSIAKEFSVAPEVIKKANQLEDELIFPKQVLLISKN